MIIDNIFFIREQDGQAERLFKSKLSEYFLATKINVRAYLAQVRYDSATEIGIALCICSNGENDEVLLSQSTKIFQSLFSSDNGLDVIFLSDKQERKIRQLCSPFYTTSNYQIDCPDFYLFSSEGYEMNDVVRGCIKHKRLYGSHPDGYLLCDVSPRISINIKGENLIEINQIVLTSRYKKLSLFPVSEWPLHVHVARSTISHIEMKENILDTDIELFGWAELYKEKIIN